MSHDAMPDVAVHFDGKRVTVDGRTWITEYRVADAKVIEDTVLLIFDRMSGPSWQQFQNLKAFDFDGNELWTAEHPTNGTADCYIKFVDGELLTVSNCASFTCRINPETGKLEEATYTK